MTTHKNFKDVVGQDYAKERLSQSIYSGLNGGEMMCPLITAEPGIGKSFLARKTIDAFRTGGFKTLYFNSPEEFRERGENYDSLIQLITGPDKFAIGIDEAHLFKNRKTVQLEKIFTLLHKMLDRGLEDKPIQIDSQTITTFNRKKGCVLLATNFPHTLDASGAFQSRCDTLALNPYSSDELVQILQVMLGKAGFQSANEKTLLQIARCGRGSARPMANLIAQVVMARSASGESRRTINREDVIYSLKLTKMFPRGVRDNEIKIMKLCKTPLRDNVILATMPDLEKETLHKSKGYLIGQGLAAQISAGFQTTVFGQRYLEEAQKEGFIL